MKTDKLIFFGKILALAIIILGIIHDIATFTPLIRGGLVCLNPGDLNAMIYMSLIRQSICLDGSVSEFEYVYYNDRLENQFG